MKRRLAIYVFAVDVYFLIREQRDCVVDIAVVDGVEHYRVAHLLDAANHLM